MPRFYVDFERGDDAHPGTQAQPVRTLKKALTLVRQAIAQGMKEDVVVGVQGRCFLEEPIRFDAQDSGRDGHKVIYRGVGATMPEIIGGRKITGWTPCGDGSYKADVGKGTVFYHMMENDQPAIMARTPNEGYFAANIGSCTDKETQRATVVIRPEDAVPQFTGKHAQVLIWPGQHLEWDGGKNYNWHASLVPIREVDWENRTLKLDDGGHYTIHPRNRYYLRGAREFLDAPGEFYLDQEAGILYYHPRRLPIEQQEIVAATVRQVVEFKADSMRAPVENIGVENIGFSLSNSTDRYFTAKMSQEKSRAVCTGMIYLQNARHITFQGCHIRNAGLSAIGLDTYNQGHCFANNLIEDNAHGGIVIWGDARNPAKFANEEEAYTNKGHVIDNNHIRRCGQLIGHGPGVEVVQAGDIEITHNLIEDMPRYAIAAYTSTFLAFVGTHKTMYGQPVTRQNYLDYIYTRNITIQFNECRYVMKDSSDGGAINLYGVGRGNRVENNFVHDLRTSLADGMLMGIYLDDCCSYATAKNNIISRLTGAKYLTPLVVKGVGNVVTNNIVADCEANWGWVMIQETPLGEFDWLPPGSKNEEAGDSTFLRNIFYRCGGPEIYNIFPWKETIIRESDYNIFYNPPGSNGMKIEWKHTTWEDWLTRAGGKFEKHTLLADPLFVDPGKMDYRLRPESPARSLGFEDIDQSQMGLRKN